MPALAFCSGLMDTPDSTTLKAKEVAKLLAGYFLVQVRCTRLASCSLASPLLSCFDALCSLVVSSLRDLKLEDFASRHLNVNRYGTYRGPPTTTEA